MKKFRIWVFLTSVACFLVLAQASKASPQAKEKMHVMSAEVVSVDIEGKTITYEVWPLALAVVAYPTIPKLLFQCLFPVMKSMRTGPGAATGHSPIPTLRLIMIEYR